MVLADLGNKISAAMSKMSNKMVIDDKVLDEFLKDMGKALISADVDVHLVKRLQLNIKASVNLEEAAGANKRKLIHGAVLKEMIRLLNSGGAPYELKKGRPNVIMFVGLQGAGKTTTVTKYAYHFKKKGWKTALICADTFRAGAFDQLKQNATKAKIPFYGSYTENDPVVTAELGVKQFKEEKFDVIIVDTSGRHKQEAALFEEMKELESAIQPDDVVFVMDGSIGQAARAQALAFKETVSVGSVIITKLDGHAKGGGALSAVAATDSPIIFVGTGEHIDDFEEFNPRSFVSRLMGMGDLQGLQKILEDSDVFNSDSQKELLEKITQGKGEFTFRDMYEQFQTLLSLGPLGKVMSMIPGMNGLLGQGKEEESKLRIKRFMTIMDSFTQQELDSSDDVFSKHPTGGQRILRIARGAGVHPQFVQDVIMTFKPFKKVGNKMKEMSQAGMLDPSKMSGRGAAANARQMASMLDPRLVQQMGGIQSLTKMMQMGMGGMPGAGGPDGPAGMPDMAAMQRMMQQMRGGMGMKGMPGRRGRR